MVVKHGKTPSEIVVSTWKKMRMSFGFVSKRSAIRRAPQKQPGPSTRLLCPGIGLSLDPRMGNLGGASGSGSCCVCDGFINGLLKPATQVGSLIFGDL